MGNVAAQTATGRAAWQRGGRYALHVAALATAAAVCGGALFSVLHAGWFSAGSSSDIFATVLLVVSPVASFVAGAVIAIARPRNPSGARLYALGMALAVWAAAISSKGAAGRYASTSVVLLRPLLFWVVLAWPVGRLSRSDRRWLAVYSALVACCWLAWVVLDPTGSSAVTPFHNHLAVVDLTRLSKALAALADNIVLPAGATILLVSVARRFRRLPASARAMGRAGLLAAIAATDLESRFGDVGATSAD